MVHAFSGRGEAVEDRADRRRILDGAEQAEAPPAPMSSIGSKSRWRVPSAQAVFSVSRMRSSPMRRSRSGTVENGYPRYAIQRLDRSLVALRLDMSIGVRGLTDSGVPELPLDPPDVRRPQATRGG